MEAGGLDENYTFHCQPTWCLLVLLTLPWCSRDLITVSQKTGEQDLRIGVESGTRRIMLRNRVLVTTSSQLGFLIRHASTSSAPRPHPLNPDALAVSSQRSVTAKKSNSGALAGAKAAFPVGISSTAADRSTSASSSAAAATAAAEAEPSLGQSTLLLQTSEEALATPGLMFTDGHGLKGPNGRGRETRRMNLHQAIRDALGYVLALIRQQSLSCSDKGKNSSCIADCIGIARH